MSIDMDAIRARDANLFACAPVLEVAEGFESPHYIVSRRDFDAVWDTRKDVPALMAEIERLRKATTQNVHAEVVGER